MAWSESLQCGWDLWMAVSDTHLLLVVPHEHKPDMTGCLTLAKVLAPGVQLVTVYDRADRQEPPVCQYRLIDGRWVSIARPAGIE